MSIEIGKKRFKEIVGSQSDLIIEKLRIASPDFADYVLNFAYGNLYNRAGLNDKYREIAAVSNLIGQGSTGLPLKTHLKGMLNVGFKKDEIIELIIFLIGYSGFPRCVEALLTLNSLDQENEAISLKTA